MVPVVTGDINVDALEDLVRLCVELDKLRQGGEARPGTTAAGAAVEQAVIGKAVDLLSGPGGLASFLIGHMASHRSFAQGCWSPLRRSRGLPAGFMPSSFMAWWMPRRRPAGSGRCGWRR